MYAPDGASLQCLMESMVENINKLYTEGFQVPSLHISYPFKKPKYYFIHLLLPLCQVNLNGQCLTFYIQYLGCKGDWPWLRSCYRLETGYKSHRICHRCPAGELCINLRLFFLLVDIAPQKYTIYYLLREWSS